MCSLLKDLSSQRLIEGISEYRDLEPYSPELKFLVFFFSFLGDTMHLIYFLGTSISLPMKWGKKYPSLPHTMKFSEIIYVDIMANSKFSKTKLFSSNT